MCLHNRYRAFAELDIMVVGPAVCDNDGDSAEQGLVVHEEEVVLRKRRPESGVANQPWVVSKVSKERSHLLVGESIARGVD